MMIPVYLTRTELPPAGRARVSGRLRKLLSWLGSFLSDPACRSRLFGWLLLALGIWGIYWAVVTSWPSWPAFRWSQVEGVVTDAGIEPGELNHSSWEWEWHPRVWYRYEVNGKKYVHDVIKAGDAPGPRIFQVGTIALTGNEATRIEHWEKQLAEKYRRDHAVTVYYNPASPAEACLERGNYPLLIFTLAASALLICSGAHRVAQAPSLERCLLK